MNIIEGKPIRWRELKNYHDWDSFVVCGTDFANTTLEEFEKYLQKVGFLPSTLHLKDTHRLKGNVLGDEGRIDTLFEIEGEGEMNPMVRLALRQNGFGLMWHTDFKHNYRRDYKY